MNSQPSPSPSPPAPVSHCCASDYLALRLHLCVLFSYCRHQRGPSFCFLGTLSSFLPQDLCLCYSQTLECHPPGSLHGWLLLIFHQASPLPAPSLLCVLELWLLVDPWPKSLKKTRKEEVARALHLTAE